MESVRLVARLRRGGVLWPGSRAAGVDVGRLAVPGLVVFAPLAWFAGLAALPMVGSVAVVNGELVLAEDPGPWQPGWMAGVAVVVVAAYAVVSGATTLLAAARQTGRQAEPAAALGMAVRRWPALLAVTAITVLGAAAVVGAVVGVQVAVRWEFLSWLTAGGLALAASPVLLAGPVLVLERRGPVQAVGRAYRLAVEGTWPDVIALLTGAVLVPALAVRAALWALDAVPAPLAITFTAALAVTVLPFQASVLTRAYLQRLAWRHTALQDSAVFPETVALKDIPSCQNGHPEPAGTWLWRLVAAVLLPAVLYAMTATANLLDRPELHQRPVTAVSDPAAAHLTGDGRLLLLLDDLDTPPTLLACTDPACTDTATVYAGPAGEDLWRDVASAPMPGGRLLLASWATTDGGAGRLDLLLCDAKSCTRPRGPAGRVSAGPHEFALAVAARPGGGGLVLAHAGESGAGKPGEQTVAFTSCADLACATPVTRQAAVLKVPAYLDKEDGFALAVAPDGRPVAAQLDATTGAVHVVSCQDAACERATVSTPVRGSAAPARGFALGTPRSGLALAMRRDGRPVIAYQAGAGGAVTLLDCRTADCPDGRTTRLSEAVHGPPVLVLDRAGRALVAYQDVTRDRIALTSCAATRCGTVPVARLNGAGGRLAMTLDTAGRPILAWTAAHDRDGGHVLVSTLLDP
ncbi:hypothetical protein ACFFR3_08625 [Nonomuraea salmonea]|uniref:ABC transporter permease n=1 Tax=Nonomuraea salmonea TaxID=46181 RepID=A0ABV5NH06_9ACTN